jgi:hypothetical protein
MRATIDGPATGWHGGFGWVGARSPGTLPPPCGSRSYHTGEEPILDFGRRLSAPGLASSCVRSRVPCERSLLRADLALSLRANPFHRLPPFQFLSFSIPEPS